MFEDSQNNNVASDNSTELVYKLEELINLQEEKELEVQEKKQLEEEEQQEIEEKQEIEQQQTEDYQTLVVEKLTSIDDNISSMLTLSTASAAFDGCIFGALVATALWGRLRRD